MTWVAARTGWSSARFVVLGDDLAGPAASRGLGHRPDVVLVGRDRGDNGVWDVASRLGVDSVVFPAGGGDLAGRPARRRRGGAGGAGGDRRRGRRPRRRRCLDAGRRAGGDRFVGPAHRAGRPGPGGRGCRPAGRCGAGRGAAVAGPGERSRPGRRRGAGGGVVAACRRVARALVGSRGCLPAPGGRRPVGARGGDPRTRPGGARPAQARRPGRRDGGHRGRTRSCCGSRPRCGRWRPRHGSRRWWARWASELRVVVRGPAPSGLSAAEVAGILGLPLAGWLRPEAGLDRLLERGEAPGPGPDEARWPSSAATCSTRSRREDRSGPRHDPPTGAGLPGGRPARPGRGSPRPPLRSRPPYGPRGRWPAGRSSFDLVGAVRSELTGAGPLDGLLADPEVSDVLVNGPAEVWLDRGHGLVTGGGAVPRRGGGPAAGAATRRVRRPAARRARPRPSTRGCRTAPGCTPCSRRSRPGGR